MTKCLGETVTDFVSAGRFVAESMKFIWSYDFHHKQVYYSVTGDYRTFKHLPCYISAIKNNHSGICSFLRISSTQQSKLEAWAFSNCKDIIYILKLFKSPLTQCHRNSSINYWQLLHSCLKQILSQFPQTFPHFSDTSAAWDYSRTYYFYVPFPLIDQNPQNDVTSLTT